MDQAVTIGMVVWASLAVLGAVAVIGGLLWFLSAIASGFNH